MPFISPGQIWLVLLRASVACIGKFPPLTAAAVGRGRTPAQEARRRSGTNHMRATATKSA
jgi:hypothetical protein